MPNVFQESWNPQKDRHGNENSNRNEQPFWWPSSRLGSEEKELLPVVDSQWMPLSIDASIKGKTNGGEKETL